jgi:hypothetical protein
MAMTASFKLSGNGIYIINNVALYMLQPAEPEHNPTQLCDARTIQVKVFLMYWLFISH